MIYDYDPDLAVTALRAADPRLGRMIERIGPFRLRDQSRLTPFQALLRSIVYQQLSGKAAGSIHARVEALFPSRRPSPKRLMALNDAQLRGAGLSRGKVRAVRDLAARCLDGTVPARARLRRMEDEAIIAQLIKVRGVGRWTAEMLLIFNLGRPDVLPVDDLGVRRGFLHTFGGRELPDAKKMLRRGRRWRPYRSVASWYLWRASEL
ncbi:MAG: DNA-3-methyladenine glycosylase 2 family protein [Gammaproteobacteria bacterium]|nr:DNA-3-methyladenine glycosylase 2 family protein [Gammaproteobacteria bacterium]